MNKSAMLLAVLAAASGGALAQANVAVFGIVDLSGNYIENGSTHTYVLSSNQLYSNRFGIRASQAMPNGMTIGAWLEAGMDNATGVAGSTQANVSNAETSPTTSEIGRLFSRRSTLQLSGDFGELRLGRDYVATFRNMGAFDVYGANGFGQLENITNLLGSGAGTQFRANNSAAYFLPGKLGGVYGEVFVSAGQGANGNKYAGARLGWASGPFDAAVAYGETNTAVSARLQDMNIGGSWNFQFAKVLGLWNQYKFGSAQQDSYELSLSVPMGAHELRAGLAHSSASGTNPLGTRFDGNAATDLSAEYVYNFMKGAAAYAQVATIRNRGGATYRVANAPGMPSVANDKSQGVGVGLAYSF
jgi:hypothetical protein